MKPIFVCIAGGSGAGKSTLAFALRDKYPDKFALLHFDDYQRSKDTIPQLGEWANWDHPDAIDFDKLLHDLGALRDQNAIDVETMNERDNPLFGKTRKRLAVTIEPRQYILVEGYLSLYHPKVREFFNVMIYLDLGQEMRMTRRTKKKGDYLEKVLIPMHDQFIEPTKEFAHVIDVSQKNKTEVLAEAEKIIFSV